MRVVAAVVQLRVVEKVFGGPCSGLNALSNQVLLYVTLLELGLAQSAISLLYQPILDREHSKVPALIIGVRKDVRLLAVIGALIVFPVLTIYAWAIHSTLPFLDGRFHALVDSDHGSYSAMCGPFPGLSECR